MEIVHQDYIYRVINGHIHRIKDNINLPIAPFVYYYDETAIDILKEFSNIHVQFKDPEELVELNNDIQNIYFNAIWL